jgi:hypothetical protein
LERSTNKANKDPRHFLGAAPLANHDNLVTDYFICTIKCIALRGFVASLFGEMSHTRTEFCNQLERKHNRGL